MSNVAESFPCRVCRKKQSVTGSHLKQNVARARRSQVRRLIMELGWAADINGVHNALSVLATLCAAATEGDGRGISIWHCVTMSSFVGKAAMLPTRS